MRIDLPISDSHPYFTTKGQIWEAVLSVITKTSGGSHARNAAAQTLRMTVSAGITGGNGGRTRLSSAGTAGTGHIHTRVWKRPGRNGTMNGDRKEYSIWHIRFPMINGWRYIRVKKFVKSISDRAVRQSTVVWTDYIKGHYRMNIGSLRTAIRGTPYYYLFKGENGYIRNYQSYAYRESYPLHTVKLMDLYSLHPWIEVLIKNGMDNIVMDHLIGEGCAGAIYWGAKTLKSAVKRFTKQDLKNVMEFNRQIHDKARRINETELSVLALAREHQYQQITVGMARHVAREGYGQFERMVATAERIGLHGMKVLEYCQKQDRGLGHAIGDWLDYIWDAEKVGLDLRDKVNSLPKDLKKWHANDVTGQWYIKLQLMRKTLWQKTMAIFEAKEKAVTEAADRWMVPRVPVYKINGIQGVLW